MRPSSLPMVLPSDRTANTVGTLYPDIWEVGVMYKVYHRAKPGRPGSSDPHQKMSSQLSTLHMPVSCIRAQFPALMKPKSIYVSQAKTAISDQLHMLKELQLQIAA